MEEEEEVLRNEEEEEEGNADLTLGILCKAAQRRVADAAMAAVMMAEGEQQSSDLTTTVREDGGDGDGDPDREDSEELSKYGNLSPSFKRKGGDAEESKSNGERKSRKRSRNKKNSIPREQEPAVLATEEKEPTRQKKNQEKKFLRGPRYFDSAEDIAAMNARKSCFNCGEPGHFAWECTVPKPCHVCGDFSHEGFNCSQVDCHKCGGFGHQARACPGRRRGSRDGDNGDGVCLYCGRPGHKTDSCGTYDASDLEAIQCYVCGEFGHLCCLDGLEKSPIFPSCYSCGSGGHTGDGCTRRTSKRLAARSQSQDSPTPQHSPPPPPPPLPPLKRCFTCNEEGHFSRECPRTRAELVIDKVTFYHPTGTRSEKPNNSTRSDKPNTSTRSEKPNTGTRSEKPNNQPAKSSLRGEKANIRADKCFNCGGDGHFARECTEAPASAAVCFNCGESGHYARHCRQPQSQTKRGADPEPEMPPRTTTTTPRIPRWMEIQIRDDQYRQQQQQQNGMLYHRPDDEQDQSNRRKQRALPAMEASSVRLPKWYAVESAEQR